jgi:hypothetical protein
MNLVRRNFILLIAFVMLLSSWMVVVPFDASANTDVKKVVDVSGLVIQFYSESENPDVKKNTLRVLDFRNDTVYLKNDVLVAARHIKAPFKLDLKFDKSLNSLIVRENKKDGVIIQFPINKTTFKVSSPDVDKQKGFYVAKDHPVAPMVKNGVVLLPLRFVAETLGYEWKFESFPQKVVPRKVDGVQGFVDKFTAARTKAYQLKAALAAEESQLNTIDTVDFKQQFRVIGDIDFVGNDYLIIQGEVKKGDTIVASNQLVHVHLGNSGVLNPDDTLERQKYFVNSGYSSSLMYSWGSKTINARNYMSFSELKTAPHVAKRKPVLDKIARLRADIKANQITAFANRDKAYQTVQNAYDNWIQNAKNKEDLGGEVRLRYEHAIHNVRLAKRFGYITFADDKNIYSYNNSWDFSEEKEHFSRINSKIDVAYSENLELTEDQQNEKHANLSGEFTAYIAKLINEYNPSIKVRTNVRKLQWIGDLQIVEELYSDNQFIRNKQKDYASKEDGSERMRANDPSLIINTAVSPRLMSLGVIALMERGDTYAGEELFNSDYDYANFLANYALNVPNNSFKSTLNDSKKQLELRFMRYDNSYWK